MNGRETVTSTTNHFSGSCESGIFLQPECEATKNLNNEAQCEPHGSAASQDHTRLSLAFL